jgi:hypothetical protein
MEQQMLDMFSSVAFRVSGLVQFFVKCGRIGCIRFEVVWRKYCLQVRLSLNG